MLTFFCLFCSFAVFGGEPVSRIIEQAGPKVRFAVFAVNGGDGSVVYASNQKRPMIPASNMKVVTTAAAIHYLKSDYTFKTHIALLDGDLVVAGGGDPVLGDPVLDEIGGRVSGWVLDGIIACLKENKITSVNSIIIDSSFFDRNRVHPSWPREQLNQWYACEVGGVNYNNNCVHILAARRGQGGVCFELTPKTDYITLINQVRAVSKGSSAIGAYRNTKPNTLIIKGTLNRPGGFDVAIEQPDAFFGYLLYEKLVSCGIAVKGKLLTQYVRNNPRLKIIKTFSTPLCDVLARCNKDSLGLAAECLVKTISAENTQGRINGEWPHGLKLIGRYLASLGVSADEFNLDDGSGLSRENRLSASALVSVLKDIYGSPDWPMYEGTLSVGGVDGTTQRYFQSARYKGNILGKTGYINGIRTFCGVCKSPRGDILFSILTEGGGGTRKSINSIAEAIFDGLY